MTERYDGIVYMPVRYDADVVIFRNGSKAVAVDEFGRSIIASDDHSKVIQYVIDNYYGKNGIRILGEFNISKPISFNVSSVWKIFGPATLSVASSIESVFEFGEAWATPTLYDISFQGNGIAKYGIYRTHDYKGPVHLFNCNFDGFTEASIYADNMDSLTDSLWIKVSMLNSPDGAVNPPGNGLILYPTFGSNSDGAIVMSAGSGKITIVGGLIESPGYVLKLLNGNYYRPIEIIGTNIENMKNQFFYMDSGTNADLALRSVTLHASSSASALIDTSVYSLTGGNVIFENVRISESSATDVIKFSEYWNVAVIGRILKGTTNVDIAGSCRVIHLNRLGYLALPIYTSLPTIATKGATIIYYDGTYYYIAVYNGSAWVKVQLS